MNSQIYLLNAASNSLERNSRVYRTVATSFKLLYKLFTAGFGSLVSDQTQSCVFELIYCVIISPPWVICSIVSVSELRFCMGQVSQGVFYQGFYGHVSVS